MKQKDRKRAILLRSIILHHMSEIKRYETHLKKIKEEMSDIIRHEGLKSIDLYGVRFAVSPETECMKLDTKKLKSKYPKIYEQCLQPSYRSATLNVTDNRKSKNK